MAGRSCYDCVYVRVDPDEWLRQLAAGQTLVPQCANHPQWPGQLREVPGTPCANFRARHPEPEGQVRRIPLGDGHYALVDAADYEELSRYTWRFYNGYAARQAGRKTIYMHRQIMQPPKGMMVDHINRHKLDNRRTNLRVCTRRENILNQASKRTSRSQFKGVEYRKGHDRCFARIRVGGKRLWLGTFDDEVEAAKAYDRAAVEHFGEFAHLNFPEDWPPERRKKTKDSGWRKEGGGLTTEGG